jgi:phage tail protein X
METTNYITKQGDRWDLIAWKAYGDITKQKEIIEQNPDIALTVEFDEGITLKLPIIPEINTQESLLPPWKR